MLIWVSHLKNSQVALQVYGDEGGRRHLLTAFETNKTTEIEVEEVKAHCKQAYKAAIFDAYVAEVSLHALLLSTSCAVMMPNNHVQWLPLP